MGTRVHVKMGGQIYREGSVLKIPEDFGEVHECPDCRYHGVSVIEGNDQLVETIKFNRQLKQYRVQKESRAVAVEAPPVPQPIALEESVDLLAQAQ